VYLRYSLAVRYRGGLRSWDLAWLCGAAGRLCTVLEVSPSCTIQQVNCEWRSCLTVRQVDCVLVYNLTIRYSRWIMYWRCSLAVRYSSTERGLTGGLAWLHGTAGGLCTEGTAWQYCTADELCTEGLAWLYYTAGVLCTWGIAWLYDTASGLCTGGLAFCMVQQVDYMYFSQWNAVSRCLAIRGIWVSCSQFAPGSCCLYSPGLIHLWGGRGQGGDDLDRENKALDYLWYIM
jgi:hypothetical protein